MTPSFDAQPECVELRCPRSTARVFEVWITASAMGFGLCSGLAALFGRLEGRLAKGLRQAFGPVKKSPDPG